MPVARRRPGQRGGYSLPDALPDRPGLPQVCDGKFHRGGRISEYAIPTAAVADVIVGVLSLIDLTLTANLIIIVICSSYENFLAPVQSTKNSDRPEGLNQISFSGLKQKLLGSIVAIAAVNVLEWFMDLGQHADNTKLAWAVGIMLAFAVAMLILAWADRVSAASDREPK